MDKALNWRYATKKFDTTKKISSQDLTELLEVLRLTPSSFGLQPWKFIIVKDPSLRRQIKGHAWNQDQVVEASDLIVLCSLKHIDDAYVKKFIHSIAKSRGTTVESLAGYEQMMNGAIQFKTAEERSHWMKRQVYIALGMLLSACAQKRIDACPMEGFDPKKVDEVLGLDKLGIESVVLCPIGYRSADDKYAQLSKVRFDKNEVLIEK